ncbi:MAG: HyaD/HybD family hydrogenase maturation endopeptidase [Geobacter sp.]|nr:HyaD/HybD family hydrogenase maturation endopeptidase [Geobacter sp.]
MAVLVLGIGNLVMSDDGVGVRVVQRLAAGYRFPPGVSLLDGGTLGLDLLPRLEGVERLLVVDAIDSREEPGTLVRLSGEEVPVALATRLSPHQMGLKDLLAVADLQGNCPAEVVLVGVQPACIEMGMELSSAVGGRFDELTQRVLDELAAWGVEPLSC